MTGTISASVGGMKFLDVIINDVPDWQFETYVSGWQPVSVLFTDVVGDVTLSFYLDNRYPEGDNRQYAAAYIDAVSIHDVSNGSDPDASVPDASIMFLLGPGLVGLGLFRRRKLRR